MRCGRVPITPRDFSWVGPGRAVGDANNQRIFEHFGTMKLNQKGHLCRKELEREAILLLTCERQAVCWQPLGTATIFRISEAIFSKHHNAGRLHTSLSFGILVVCALASIAMFLFKRPTEKRPKKRAWLLFLDGYDSSHETDRGVGSAQQGRREGRSSGGMRRLGRGRGRPRLSRRRRAQSRNTVCHRNVEETQFGVQLQLTRVVPRHFCVNSTRTYKENVNSVLEFFLETKSFTEQLLFSRFFSIVNFEGQRTIQTKDKFTRAMSKCAIKQINVNIFCCRRISKMYVQTEMSLSYQLY